MYVRNIVNILCEDMAITVYISYVLFCLKYNYKLSFTNRNYSTNTSSSIHIWYISSTITWEILKIASTYSKKKKNKKTKMPSLSPWETNNHHSPITKDPAKKQTKKKQKKKNRNSIQMRTREQTFTLTFQPIHITYPPYLYYPPQHTHKYHLSPLKLYIHLHTSPNMLILC